MQYSSGSGAIGHTNSNTTFPDYLNGSIDEVRVYSRVLNTDEIHELYAPEPPVPTVSEWGLIVMAVLVLTAGTLVFLRRRPAKA